MVTRERSRSYPGSNLEESVENIKKIRKQLGKGKLDKNSIAKGLGYQSYFGKVGTKMSAMVQFGLLDRNKAGYSLSSLSERMTHPKDNNEYIEAIKQSFNTPELYRELSEKYESDGTIPEQLANILYRDHRVTNGASSESARVFIESAIFANVIDNENNFISTSYSTLEDLPIYVLENKSQERSEKILEMVPLHETESNIHKKEDHKGSTGKQTFNFALSGGKLAQLVVPMELNPKDILIIRKQIELLELQIEEA